MKKKGFTLIELLAVIVILAIIALIATPIVMNTIENAKKGAAERGADSYMKAVETAVGTERIDGNILEGEYTILDNGNLCKKGDVCAADDEIKIDMSGNKPSSGTIVIENGIVVSKSSTTQTATTMTIGDYDVNYDIEKKSYVAIKSKEDTPSIVCTFNNVGEHGKVGAQYSCDFGSGARNFYILELGTSPVTDSILNSDEIALILEGNYEKYSYTFCDLQGPNPYNAQLCNGDGLTATLDEIASAWSELDSDQIGLPSAYQVAAAAGRTFANSSFRIASANAWLYNYPDNSNYSGAYWTSTVKSSSYIWFVDYYGYINQGGVGSASFYGKRYSVRPVVTIPKEILGL